MRGLDIAPVGADLADGMAAVVASQGAAVVAIVDLRSGAPYLALEPDVARTLALYLLEAAMVVDGEFGALLEDAAQRIEVPVADVADVAEVKYTPPRLGGTFNGSMRFEVRTPDLATLSGYGGRAPVPPEGTEEYAVGVRQGVMTPEALVAHWHEKDAGAFEAICAAIAADVQAR